jgi:hypothetical protein
VPVVPGRYQVGLHFATLQAVRPGARLFTVLLEGNTALDAYEPPSSHSSDADIKTFEVDVADGFLDLDFLAERGDPRISGIEITPSGW